MQKDMGCVKMPLFPTIYNEILVRKVFAYLIADIDKANSPSFEHVYVSGAIIAFTPVNIVAYLTWPHYPDIEALV